MLRKNRVLRGDEAIKHSSHTTHSRRKRGVEGGRERRKEKEVERERTEKGIKRGIPDSRIRNSENLKSKFDLVVRKG